jgi:hypothetical protein
MCNSLDQQFPGVFHFENDQAYKHAKERDLIIREDREGRIVLKGKEQKHEALQRHSDTLTVPCPALPCPPIFTRALLFLLDGNGAQATDLVYVSPLPNQWGGGQPSPPPPGYCRRDQ